MTDRLPTDRGRLRALARGVYRLAVAGVGFVLMSVLVRSSQPLSAFGHLGPKFEHWQAHADEYDLLFLGSSRVTRDFDPAQFDRLMTAGGQPTRSFNFGILGIRAIETDVLLDRILSNRPSRLKRVFVEFPLFAPGFPNDGRQETTRDVSWHTLDGTYTALRAVAAAHAAHAALGTSVRLATTHCRMFLEYATNYGLVMDRLFAPEEQFDSPQIVDELLARDGFQPSPAPGEKIVGARRDIFGAGPRLDPRSRTMEKFAERNTSLYSRRWRVNGIDVESYRREVARAADAGIELWYVTIPSKQENGVAYRLHDAGVIPHLLEIDDPRRYPDLWETKLYSDDLHMNSVGAARFTTRLAEDYLAEAKHGK